MSFTLAHRAECETIGNWKLVRRTLELESFGVNIVEIGSGEQIPEHDEIDRDQEEVFLVLAGDATLVIDGQDHVAPAERLRAWTPSTSGRCATTARSRRRC